MCCSIMIGTKKYVLLNNDNVCTTLYTALTHLSALELINLTQVVADSSIGFVPQQQFIENSFANAVFC